MCVHLLKIKKNYGKKSLSNENTFMIIVWLAIRTIPSNYSSFSI